MTQTSNQRIQSIDLLRGLVIILMALDHVRDYFHHQSFYYSPTDLTQTSAPIFFTRFVTHFCAPIFCFLAGTSAFFVGQRRSRSSLSLWLIKRGLVLVLLEFTVINFGWYFKMNTNFIDLSVIWCLGISMIFLAGFIHLPKSVTITAALIIIFGHNLLDTYRPPVTDFLTGLWTIFHVEGEVKIGNITLYPVYPLLPWIGIMALGYYLGQIYLQDYDQRKRRNFLFFAGTTLIILFLVFRSTNFYGDLHPWIAQETKFFTLLSIFNVTKYPPSFSFVCITIGPGLLFLAAADKLINRFTNVIVSFGQVPMFFYIVHIYLIHAIAVVAAVLTGYKFSDMILSTWVVYSVELKGYGFNLLVVFLIWIGIIIAMYPLCKWYNKYKATNKQKWWLSYI